MDMEPLHAEHADGHRHHHHPHRTVDNRAVHAAQRHRGSVEHNADNSEGTHPRVRDKESHRRNAVVDTETDNRGERDNNNILRIHRDGARGGGKRIHGCHNRPHHHQLRHLRGNNIPQPNGGARCLHRGNAGHDHRRYRGGTCSRAQGSDDKTDRGIEGGVMSSQKMYEQQLKEETNV